MTPLNNPYEIRIYHNAIVYVKLLSCDEIQIANGTFFLKILLMKSTKVMCHDHSS